MYSMQKPTPLITAAADHHVAAAEYHESAAGFHRQAAAYYGYGDYQQANEQAKLAKDFGRRAENYCGLAME